jgi:hypothetical protein
MCPCNYPCPLDCKCSCHWQRIITLNVGELDGESLIDMNNTAHGYRGWGPPAQAEEPKRP